MTGKMSKADGRKSTRHQAKYKNQVPKLAKKKDKRVAKSSHGKFKNVAALEAHRLAVSAK